MNTSYTFSDVLIIPKSSNNRSRKDVNLTTSFLNLQFPIISSNMKSITGPKMAIEMCKNGGFGILHRFCSIDQAIKDFKEVFDGGYNCGVSIGVQEFDKQRLKKLYNAGARIFCVDVAHGDSILVKEMLQWINRRKYRSQLYIIVGNIATGDSFNNLANLNVDAVKVGIGPGSACQTRRNTGVGVPQLSALEDCYINKMCREIEFPDLKKVSIIADGGISFPSDIAKALKYADIVMLGGMIAGTSETPGKVFRNKENQFYKVYMGSASAENKISSNQETNFVEGMAIEVPFRGHVKYILKEIKDGLQSAFSYVGAKNLKEFKEKCEFIHISSGSKIESKI